MPFFEVSCKSNINIEDAFLSLARKIREQRERRVSYNGNVQLEMNLNQYVIHLRATTSTMTRNRTRNRPARMAWAPSAWAVCRARIAAPAKLPIGTPRPPSSRCNLNKLSTMYTVQLQQPQFMQPSLCMLLTITLKIINKL